jgi:hypothetical protein
MRGGHAWPVKEVDRWAGSWLAWMLHAARGPRWHGRPRRQGCSRRSCRWCTPTHSKELAGPLSFPSQHALPASTVGAAAQPSQQELTATLQDRAELEEVDRGRAEQFLDALLSWHPAAGLPARLHGGSWCTGTKRVENTQVVQTSPDNSQGARGCRLLGDGARLPGLSVGGVRHGQPRQVPSPVALHTSRDPARPLAILGLAYR